MAETKPDTHERRRASRSLEAVAHFEVVRTHNPDDTSPGAPAEGETHLRAVAPSGDEAAALVLPQGTHVVARGQKLRLGDRYAVRLPLEAVKGAAAGDQDDES
jgi:hypothetical protein